MTDKEKLTILNQIKMYSGDAMGTFRIDILILLMHMQIPEKAANECIDALIADKFLQQSTLNEKYSLTPKAESWLNDFENRHLVALGEREITFRHIVEPPRSRNYIPFVKPEKSSFRKAVEFLSWIIVIVGTVIGTYFLFVDHIAKKH